MKKIILFFVGMMTLAVSSCSDMLEVDSDRGLIMPDIDDKTDSLFYAFGIMQAMQQAADAYVLQNELRGDLVTTTRWSDKDLRDMETFSATAANKYDSAYVYYKVINNCNYYLAHRDTSLYDGSYNVAHDEYAAVLAFRAWAYLQATRAYGKVKFFTHPLTSISQIEEDDSPVLGIDEIVAQLAPELEKFTGTKVPSFKAFEGVTASACFIPVDVILGELYLEAGGEIGNANYLKAAQHYYRYLLDNKALATNMVATYFNNFNQDIIPPADFEASYTGYSWEINRNNTSPGVVDYVVTYIPMAKNYMRGKTTNLPRMFGHDIYTVSGEADSIYPEKIQLQPSAAYNLIADSSDYYYTSTDDALGRTKKYFRGTDQRRWELLQRRSSKVHGNSGYVELDTAYYVNVFDEGNIVIYRSATIWLQLAEALNRYGHPDAAFAILKDGITDDLLTDSTYITKETKDLLTTTLPFCSYSGTGPGSLVFSQDVKVKNYGIHKRGCGDDNGCVGVFSPYQMDTIVRVKLGKLMEAMPATVVPTATKADTINAVEDIICDEYAMEIPFEGNRFGILRRMARNKNKAGLYGANFGSLWLNNKLAYKGVDLSNEETWYLPFK